MSRQRSRTTLVGSPRPARGLALLLSVCAALPLTSAQARANHANAAQDPAHAAVIGGRPVVAGAFASVAYILDFRGVHVGQCSGTVVAPTLILTAGHCAENVSTGVANRASGYRVMTGGVDRAGSWQESTVSAVLVYEGFRRRSADGDAALLVLATPTTVPPIALATTSGLAMHPAGSSAMFAGWGETRYEQTLPTDRLQWADTVIQAGRWCRRNAPPFDVHGELCTISAPSYATGACDGDSGGPLVVSTAPAGGELVQVGIASHVYGRCSTRLPSVFTSVAPISAWVRTWIAAYGLRPAPPTP